MLTSDRIRIMLRASVHAAAMLERMGADLDIAADDLDYNVSAPEWMRPYCHASVPAEYRVPTPGQARALRFLGKSDPHLSAEVGATTGEIIATMVNPDDRWGPFLHFSLHR